MISFDNRNEKVCNKREGKKSDFHSRNIKNRRPMNVKLFEFGKTYHNFGNGREEHKHLSLLLSGHKTDDSWAVENVPISFFYLKGVVTAILDRLGIHEVVEKEVKNKVFAEGITLEKNKKALVSLGVLKKPVLKAFGVENETLYVFPTSIS